jgi:hypothetical protein
MSNVASNEMKCYFCIQEQETTRKTRRRWHDNIKRDLRETGPRVVTAEKNSPTVAHACRKRRLKWVLAVWGYNWATQSPGDINMETWSSRLGVGRGADDPTPEKVNS